MRKGQCARSTDCFGCRAESERRSVVAAAAAAVVAVAVAVAVAVVVVVVVAG